MSLRSAANAYATHDVSNQPGDLSDVNLFKGDLALSSAISALDAGWAQESLTRTGALVGSKKLQKLARDANRHSPELRSHDRFGNRIDEIELHPAWHKLMGLAIGTEAHSFAW